MSAAGSGAGGAGTKPGSGKPRWSLGGWGRSVLSGNSGQVGASGGPRGRSILAPMKPRGAHPSRATAARRLGTPLRLREGDPGLSGAAPAVGRE